MKIGEKIRGIRELIKLSPEEFARRLGVSVHAVEILETNVTNIGKQALLRIAKALQMTVADIEDFKEETASFHELKSYRNRAINDRACKEFQSLIDSVISKFDELLEKERAKNAIMQKTIASLKEKIATLEMPPPVTSGGSTAVSTTNVTGNR